MVNRYHAMMLAEIQQSAACNVLHNLPKRMCRLLLEAHDRTGLMRLPLTQELLVEMLGARRISITQVQAPLATAGVISIRRGEVVLKSLDRLRENSCECYELLKERAELIVPGWKSPRKA